MSVHETSRTGNLRETQNKSSLYVCILLAHLSLPEIPVQKFLGETQVRFRTKKVLLMSDTECDKEREMERDICTTLSDIWAIF